MRQWRVVSLGLAASSSFTGGQDAHLPDLEASTSLALVTNDRGRRPDLEVSNSLALISSGGGDGRQLFPLEGGGRQLTTAAFTAACPKVRKHSLKLCDRCLSNEMCPAPKDGVEYECQAMTKRCTQRGWNATTVSLQCPEDLKTYSKWGAFCLYTCLDQKAPFTCAGFCINEDYPCKWVPDCFAASGDMRGMTADSSSCLRPCHDHNSMLQVELKHKQMAKHIDHCVEAVKFYGCSNKFGANILELCPQTCRTKECEWRCGRDEVPTVTGEQCWRVVERTIDQYSCARAISEGMDCHCKCGGAYLQLSRAGGGSFKHDGFYGDDSVAFKLTTPANRSFSITLTGQAMRTERVTDAWGPRLKIVVKGQDCRYGRLISGLSGLQCLPPPPGSPSASTASQCVTPPSKATPYIHRWLNLRIDMCGEYAVCHCNYKCDLTKNWYNVGTVTTVPLKEVGGVSKPLPGCERAIPEATTTTGGPIGEQRQESLSKISLKIYGGLDAVYRKNTLHASKAALVSITKAHSGLLGKKVPEPNDVTVTYADRRLRESAAASISADDAYRRLQLAELCVDNEAALAAEASKINEPYTKCSQVSGMCAEKSIQAAIQAGCRKTCKLCEPTTTTAPTTTLPPAVQVGSAMSFNFEITTYTDWSTANVMYRLDLLKKDPVPYIQRLFFELEEADVLVIPARLWVSVSSGPTTAVVPKATPAPPVKEKLGASSIIFIALGCAIGGSILIGCCFVAVWYVATRGDKWRKVQPEGDREIHQISDGGYRIKKTKIPGEEAPPEPEPDCLERCCMRCCKRLYTMCCVKKLKKAKAFSQEADTSSAPGEVTIGSTVKLFGLSASHYNGLTGTVISGPNEKGRYEVDLVTVDNGALEEHKTVSFKPDNMRVIVIEEPVFPDSPASPEPAAKKAPTVVKPSAKAFTNQAPGGEKSYRTAKN